MRRLFIIIFALPFALLISNVLKAQTYTGNIDVVDNDYRPVQLSPNLLLFPGEKITVQMSGQANINHHHYEVRKCSWFGLSCRWVPRSRANWRPVSELELVVGLYDASGKLVPGSRRVWKGTGDHVMMYPNNYKAGFATPLRAKAYFRSWNGASYHRTRCNGRPRYCSTGSPAFTVSASDIKKRLELLVTELNNMGNSLKTVDPVHIRSDRFIDNLLRDTPEKRAALLKIFADMMECWNGSEGANNCEVENADSAPEVKSKILDVARYAKSFGDDPKQISRLNRVMFDAYIAQGDYETLISESADALKVAKNAYDKNDTAQNAIRLADLLRGTGIARLEKRARYSSTDVRFAVGLMEQAIAVLEKHVKDQGSESDNTYDKLLDTFSSYYIDTARMMNVLRTPAELRYAERILDKAVCVKELSLKKDRTKNEILNCLGASA